VFFEENKTMTMMAVRIQTAGFGDSFSAGAVHLAFTLNGGHQVYRWIGTGGSGWLANARIRPFEIPYCPCLQNFSGQDVLLTVKGGIPLGGRTQMGLSIRYSGGSRAELYNIAPSAPENLLGATVVGPITSDLEIFGQYRLLHPGQEKWEIVSALF
jgi:hypothetical protein